MADDGSGAIDQSLFTDAGLGSLDAQRVIRDRALALVAVGAEPVGEAAILAETFARLAAGHGHVEDSARLAGAIMLRASVADMPADLRELALAESLARATLAADAGHERSALTVACAPQAGFSANVFALARAWLSRATGR